LFSDERFVQHRADLIQGDSVFRNADYDVFVINPFTETLLDLSQYVVEINYSYDYQTAFAVTEITFANTTNIFRFIRAGYWLVWYGPYFPNVGAKVQYAEIDRGIISQISANIGDDKSVQVTVKSPAWLLAKNIIPYRLPEGTLTERLRFLSGRGLLNLEEPLLDTQYVLSPTRGGRESVWEDITFDLAETNRARDKKYVLRHRKGRFYLWDTEVQKHMFALEIGSNIFRATRSFSLEDYYNVINVIGEESSGLEFLGLTSSDIAAKVELVYQTIENLHEACPNDLGDWYFTGDYPTPGGNKVVNKSFINYIEGKNIRAY